MSKNQLNNDMIHYENENQDEDNYHENVSEKLVHYYENNEPYYENYTSQSREENQQKNRLQDEKEYQDQQEYQPLGQEKIIILPSPTKISNNNKFYMLLFVIILIIAIGGVLFYFLMPVTTIFAHFSPFFNYFCYNLFIRILYSPLF